MKSLLRRSTICLVCIVGSLVITLATRLAHPDMTEARLFMEFWPRWITAICLAGLALWLSQEWPSARRP